MRFFSFIGKNVLRRKVRSLLTGLGVAVAIAAVVALLGVSSGFEESQVAMLKDRGVDVVVTKAGLGDQATARLDQSIADLGLWPLPRQRLADLIDSLHRAGAKVIGVDKILFGSDWPHGEGLESPLSFAEELVGFSDSDIRKVMRDNAIDLLGVQVGSAA